MNNRKQKKCVASVDEEATNRNEDWKKMCKDCEILRLYNDCTFGCELVKAHLRRKAIE